MCDWFYVSGGFYAIDSSEQAALKAILVNCFRIQRSEKDSDGFVLVMSVSGRFQMKMKIE